MNERIQALAIEASADLDPEDYMGASEEFLELFAQLLVREYTQRLIQHGVVSADGTIVKDIKKHFGVEE
jgi:hypothetical protein